MSVYIAKQTEMKFLLCCSDYFPSIGGVQEVVRQIAEGLVARGHDVTVATSFLSERSSSMHNGVLIRDFKIAGNLATGIKGDIDEYNNFVLSTEWDAILVKAAQQWTFDVLWPILDKITARKIFIPCGFSKLQDPSYANYFKELTQVLFKWDHLVFYSDTYQDIRFVQALNYKNYTVLPNGASEVEFNRPADPEFTERVGIEPEAKVLLTVGSLTGLKGHLEVLQAFSKIKYNKTKLLLILNGHLHTKLAKPEQAEFRGIFSRLSDKGTYTRLLASASDLIDLFKRLYCLLRSRPVLFIKNALKRIFRLGAVPAGKELEQILRELIASVNQGTSKRVMLVDLDREQLVQAYLRADLFLFASRIECSPLVLYEAAAASTPFLSINVGNAEEIAAWTKAGVVIKTPINKEGLNELCTSEFARKIDELLVQPDLLDSMGVEGRQRWSNYFSWKTLVTHYEEILIGKECTIGNFRH
jgi:glycosyltransferase involved in cell wall biosynthesis